MKIEKGKNDFGIRVDHTCSCGQHYSYLGPDFFIDTETGYWFDCICKSTCLVTKDNSTKVPFDVCRIDYVIKRAAS